MSSSRPLAEPALTPGSAARPRFFYGWYIVGAGVAIQGAFAALFGQVFGSYVVILHDQFGWSKTAISAASSMQHAESGIAGPLQGWLVTRFGARAVIRIGVLFMASGFLVFSQLNSLLTFYAAMFLLAVGTSLGGFLPITTVVVNWFERRRSMALGLVTGGVGIGGALAPLTAWAIDSFGWRETTFASGIIIAAIGLPAASLIRARPEDHGLQLDGGPRRERPDRPHRIERPVARPDRDYTLNEALHTRQFWFIGLGHAAALLVVSAVTVHATAHLKETLGWSIKEATLVLTVVVLSQSAGTLGGGWLGDRLNKQGIVVACMFGHAAALILLANATATWMVFVFGIVHGISWGVRGPLMAAIRADYFGRSAFGLIFGASQALVVLGLIGGPLLAGILYDITGNYEAGFVVLAILAAAGSLFFVMSPPPVRRASPVGGS